MWRSTWGVGNCLNVVFVNKLSNIIYLYTLHDCTDKPVAYKIKTGCTNCVPNWYDELQLKAIC